MVLSVGDKVLMQYAALGDRLVGVITDIRHGESVVVYSPLSQLALERLQKNNTAILKYVHEGVLKGYKTKVVLEAIQGDSLVTLAYPLEEIFVENRSEPRCPCCFPGHLSVPGKSKCSVFVVDVSASAVRVRFKEKAPGLDAFDQGQDIHLDFYVFEPENQYGAFCTILKTFMRKGVVYAVLGIRDGEAVRETLAHYVKSQCRSGALNQV